MTPLRLLLTTGLLVGPMPGPHAQDPAPQQPVLIQPQAPAKTGPVQPAQPPEEPERVEGQVLDPDHDAGIKVPRAPKARVAPAKTKKKPVEKEVRRTEIPADHDERAARRTWHNSDCKYLPTSPVMKTLTSYFVTDWAQMVPAIIPGPNGSFSPSQQVIMASIRKKPVELQGFVRAYRRLTLPTGTFATFWIGPSQASPLSDCIIARIPATRMPYTVNEYLLGLAATKGWAIKARGWPNYQLQTKYRVGIDRLIPWELDPVERCDIETPMVGAPPEAGAPGAFHKLTVDGD